MKIIFFPYDFEYKIKGGKVLMYLYSKLENGDKVCVIHEHQPYFFAKVEGIDLEQLQERLDSLSIEQKGMRAQVVKFENIEKELLGKKEQFYKIYTNYPKAVPVIAKQLEEWGVKCFERDILFVHRYLRDTGITPMTLAEAQGEFKEQAGFRIPTFIANSVKDTGKESPRGWKILGIDIETYAERKEINMRKNPILMIALYGQDRDNKEFRKVITWRKFDHDLSYVEHVSDEVELLQRFRNIMLEYQPDIVTGYFTDGFDFPYIRARADKYNIKMDLGLDHSELICGQRESKIKGMLHLDMFKFIRYILGLNLKTDSYSLDAVSEELLGHRKHDVNLDHLADTWDNKPEKLGEFVEYNMHDAHLAFKLCHNLLSDMIAFTKIIGLPTFDVTRMRFSRLVENYILKRAMEFNVVAPNKPGNYELERRRDEHIQGAFVYEPTPGIYENVIVFDFRSLYPTIISAHNIGPEGFRCDCCKDQEHVPERADFWFCGNEKNFLPKVLERLILRRVDLKRLITQTKEKGEDVSILEARSYALKILANSFYGYLGFFGARWYSLESAASTTAYARDYIKTTIEKARLKGFDVIYADTDSCFLLLGENVMDTAMEFMNEINFDLPGHMELEFEGFYPRGIFVAAKGSDKGAKKKYALIDEDNKVKITGFETVRRNWSMIAKEVQKEVLQLVLEGKGDEAVTYVKSVVDEMKKGKVDLGKLIIKTQITKDISKYSAIGPHVAVALRMIQKGDPVGPGTVVEYVICKGEGLIRERAKLVEEMSENEYDCEYYIEHQIKPAVMGVFLVLGLSSDEVFEETRQTGLGSYF